VINFLELQITSSKLLTDPSHSFVTACCFSYERNTNKKKTGAGGVKVRVISQVLIHTATGSRAIEVEF
jgi:hypothetical protein